MLAEIDYPQIDVNALITLPGMEYVRSDMLDRMFLASLASYKEEIIEEETIDRDTIILPTFEQYIPGSFLNRPLQTVIRIEEEEALKREMLISERQAFIDSFKNSSALQRFDPHFFISNSKGRRLVEVDGRTQWVKIPRLGRVVELIGLNDKRYITPKDGGGELDRYMPEGKIEEEVMEEFRRLHKGLARFRKAELPIKRSELR